MAFVCIDEALFSDLRFKALVRELDEDDGLGEKIAMALCLRAFMVAQKYWRENNSYIPANIWRLLDGGHLLIKFELAIKDEDGSVYVKGSQNCKR